ncbi:hypothetical protein EB72_01435 [Mycobacterium sp. SWH-M1]|nr:hypothetical protein EB72_01435 [Mycobacterium sp. SWH-M1]
MALPAVEFRYLDQIHSPFSGIPAGLDDEGVNHEDPTLLFVYCGDVSEWSYVSPRFPSEFTRFIDNVEVDEVAQSLDIDGAVLLVVDADWNGIDYYAFAPADSEIKFTEGVVFAESAAESPQGA